MADNTKTFIILGAGAVVAWYLYENGYLYQWFGAAFLPSGATPPTTIPVTTTTTPVTTPPVIAPVTTTSPVTPTSPPISTTPTSPPAATISLLSAVTPNINNSLTATISINGTPTNITVIPTTGHAYNSAGADITTSLTAQGVNVAALIAAMQAAYVPAPNPPSNTATFSLTSAVTPNVNNSLTGMVSVKGGTPQNVTIIQSNGHAYNTSGQDITSSLTSQGVNVPALLAAMQAAYKSSGTSGLGFSSRVPLGWIHSGPSYRMRMQ
jgi:hypothetical protein